VLATAEESWRRIQALCVRVQDLEFALERAHGLVTRDRHPLSEDELVKIAQESRDVIKPDLRRFLTVPPEDAPMAHCGDMKKSNPWPYMLFVGGLLSVSLILWLTCLCRPCPRQK
jgi:hypothetical protein